MTIEVKKDDFVPYRAINEALDRSAAEIEHQNKYIVTFEFDGGQWDVDIWAKDWEEAERKCNALRETAKVIGEVGGKIPYKNQDL
jgi:hypothetical protein